MIDTPPELGPELRALAQAVLAILAPLVHAGFTLIPGDDADPSGCQQVWCPVCAVAAVAAGERHPLATIVAEHGVALLSLLQTVASSPPAAAPSAPAAAPPATSGYEPIPVTIHD